MIGGKSYPRIVSASAILVLIAAAWVFVNRTTHVSTGAERSGMTDLDGTVNAPEFPAGLDWLNTDRPLSLRDLKGKVVLLDFWTYCCINCMHVLPDLKKLEHEFRDELAVVGVHSAKFTAEGETDNIRQAILRYEIEHPVLNDNRMILWREYGVRAWPTLVLINPEGRVIGQVSGEGIYEPLSKLIRETVEHFDAKGLIDRTPLQLVLEREKTTDSILSFPGKVLADKASGRLFVADSNHNRVVVLSLGDFTVSEIIGSGGIGFDDGGFDRATFNHPQGMALDGGLLYVADTENHALRAADLERKTVTTIAGTGEQARSSNVAGPGRSTALNSPWDLLVQDGALYIAMAGPHQLWRLDLKSGRVEPYAGSGREARIDGPLKSAALAQPSGLTSDGRVLYFADSEVSSIRSADLDPRGEVKTIVGGDLFEFGDRDGVGLRARLQHPLGVAYHDGYVYVADTYNNKIRRVDPEKGEIKNFIGTGESGLADGSDARFDEPAGLTVADNTLYVADTNNHVIRAVDLKTRQVRTVTIKNLEKMKPAPAERFGGEIIEVSEQVVEPGPVELTIDLDLPDGYKLTPNAPSTLSIGRFDGSDHEIRDRQTTTNPMFPVKSSLQIDEGISRFQVDYTVYFCRDSNEGLCYFDEARLLLPVTVRKGAGNRSLTISYQPKTP